MGVCTCSAERSSELGIHMALEASCPLWMCRPAPACPASAHSPPWSSERGCCFAYYQNQFPERVIAF